MGRVCGSSFINERFKALVTRKLEGEEYLWVKDSFTVSQLVRDLVVDFETEKKSLLFSFQKSHMRFRVQGLKENREKNFNVGYLLINS